MPKHDRRVLQQRKENFQTIRISPIHRIIAGKPIQINPTPLPYRVPGHPASYPGIIEAIAIEIQSRIFVIGLGGEAHGLVDAAGGGHLHPEGIVLVGLGHVSYAIQQGRDVALSIWFN